jgi:hypothetical protein
MGNIDKDKSVPQENGSKPKTGEQKRKPMSEKFTQEVGEA